MAISKQHLMPATAHDSQSNAQIALTTLEGSLFIRADELQNKVSIATKNAEGRICWVTLDPAYHSKLVRTAIAAAKAISPTLSVASIKEALFIFLLNILNGKPQEGFFHHTEPEQKGTIKHRRTAAARKENQTLESEPTTRTQPPFPRPRPPTPLCDRPPAKEVETQHPNSHAAPPSPQGEDFRADYSHLDHVQDPLHDFMENIENREREKLVKTHTEQAHTTTTNSPSERRASQEAQPQEMKRILNGKAKPIIPITRLQTRKQLKTRPTRTSPRPGA